MYKLPAEPVTVILENRAGAEKALSMDFQRLVLAKSLDFNDLEWLLKFKEKIKHLRISSRKYDVKAVSQLVFLESLDVQDTDATGLDFSGLLRLEKLKIDLPREGVDWDALSKLRYLNLNKCTLESIEVLSPLTRLEGLILSSCRNFSGVVSFDEINSLKAVDICGAPKVEEIVGRNLGVINCENMKRLEVIKTGRALRYLKVIKSPSFLFDDKMLNSDMFGFRLGGSGNIPSLVPFTKMNNLRELVIGDGSKVEAKDFEVLDSLTASLIKVGGFSRTPHDYSDIFAGFEELGQVLRRCL